MRVIRVLLGVLFVVSPGVARGQSFLLDGAVGPTINDAGYSIATGIGFTPVSRIAVSAGLERTHLSSELQTDRRGGMHGFRGGTLTLASAQLRISLLRRDRIGPYGVVGYSAGVSRPTVNELFPDAVTNHVHAMFFGGGIHIPLRERISLFGDARMTIGSEAGELLAVLPMRAGIAWSF